MKERLFIEDSKKYVRIEELLLREFANSLCGGIDIQETPLGTRIIIYTMAPGLVIGTGGEKIRAMTEKLRSEFGLKNPQIDVQKIRKPDLNPSIVAQNICAALEKGMNFKKIGNLYLARVMRAGARGCEIVIAGKLGGEKSRKERFFAGFVEKSGTREAVLKGTWVATPKLGNIGIKVFIMLKDYSELAEEAQEKQATESEVQEEKKEAQAQETPAQEPASQEPSQNAMDEFEKKTEGSDDV